MQPENGFSKKLYPIFIVTLIVFVSVFSLSSAYRYAEPKIKEQEERARLANLKKLFPDMTDYRTQDDIYVVAAGDKTIGYAFLAVGKGYGGKINILVALEDENTIKGIAILSHLETPGLGARVAKPAFTDRFAGKKIQDIKLKSKGGQIDGITGSTISSRAVIDAVGKTALEKAKLLPK